MAFRLCSAYLCQAAVLATLSGCEAFDPSLLEPPAALDSGQTAMDGGGGPTDGMAPGDGSQDACAMHSEICNAEDDDCDGEIDEDTTAYCEEQLPNSRAVCDDIGRCLNLDCLDGFISCDGEPSNGCEPYCSCRPCPDAGEDPDDAGDDDAGDDPPG